MPAIQNCMDKQAYSKQPFHPIPSYYFRQRGPSHTDETNMIQEGRESVQLQSTENTQTHLPVAAISSEWRGDGGLGAKPPAGSRGRRSPPEAEKELNFDNTKLL